MVMLSIKQDAAVEYLPWVVIREELTWLFDNTEEKTKSKL